MPGSTAEAAVVRAAEHGVGTADAGATGVETGSASAGRRSASAGGRVLPSATLSSAEPSRSMGWD
eukprot:scaffold101796_cov28-Tisochrysis_lutea.AAC.2